MRTVEMACRHCAVSIKGEFPMSRIGRLPVEHQRFVEMFILCGGNLKELAQQVGVSYPTIRTRLDRVIEALRGEIAKTHPVRGSALDAVDEGDAARIIKEIE
jgi:hypothetical protein